MHISYQRDIDKRIQSVNWCSCPQHKGLTYSGLLAAHTFFLENKTKQAQFFKKF